MFTRTPPPTTERRRGLSYIIGGAVVVYLALTGLGTLWTDFLWFDSLGFDDVWQKRWSATVLLALGGVAVAGLVFWANLVLADRLGPRYPVLDTTEEEELVVRFRGWVEGRVRSVRIIVAVLFGLFLGLGVAAWRTELFLFSGRQSFGVDDPLFGLDVGFYVFQLPIIEISLRWLFNLVAVALALTIAAHYLNGGVRIRRGMLPTFARGSKIHVSVLLAVLALVRAALYRVDALNLLYSSGQAPAFFGPGYTDIAARLPAQRLLMAIAVVAAGVFILNIWRKGWVLVVVSVAGWVVVSVAALLIYPSIVERLRVLPEPFERQAEYIADHIAATRMAYGLDDVEVREFPAVSAIDSADIEANRLTIDNLRLWDAAVLPRTYQNLQEIRAYYAMEEVDTDRYVIAGEPTQTMIAVRELDEQAIPRVDWQNTRLVYTHGLGAVVSQANAVETDGQPEFLLSDLPPVESDPVLALDTPGVYFGESYQPGRPVIVNTGSSPQEVDMPEGTGEGINTVEYDGGAGVEVGNLLRRIAFAFRYRDLNLLISGQLRPDSRVLVQRNIDAILSDVAPFLAVDSDPYPVIADGRVTWVVDLYTTSSFFPYAQPISTATQSRLPVSTQLTRGTNYVASSVKATIDAYDGDVAFYVVDDSDPIVAAWREVHPSLFQDGSAMPEELADHLRYPQDLFTVQGEIYLEHHVDEELDFFNNNDVWSIPPDPASIRRGEAGGGELLLAEARNPEPDSRLAEMLPYYLLMRLPGEEDLSYVLLQPFNPLGKPNMSSFLVADAPSPTEPGRLVDFRMPQGTLVGGTGQIGDRIQQNDEIAEQFSLWDQQGSEVIQGDLLVVPIEESVMYVQPVYLQSVQESGFPEFRRVIVVFGDQIEWASTLDGALAEIFGAELAPETPVDGPTEPGDGGPLPEGVRELLTEAASLLDDAEQALRDGDLGTYQELVEQAGALIDEANSLAGDGLEAALR